jgi:hypothetical protein
MTSPTDLNILHFSRQAGNDQADLPDLYAVTPPHRTARGREADNLIIYLSMTGNSPFSAEEQTQLLEKLAGKFYKTPGSLTAALRTITDALNLHLLDRNLRSTSVGRQGIGQLILAALRADTIYLTQCGVVHAFLVTPTETQHLHDPQSSGRGLGLSRTAPMRFLQVKMNPDDFLILSTLGSPGWNVNTIKHPQPQSIDILRRQLTDTAGPDFNAVIIQAQTGTGKLRLLKRRVEASATAVPIPSVPPVPVGISTSVPVAENDAELSKEDKRLGLQSTPSTAPGISPQIPQDRKLGLPPSPPSPADVSTAEAQEPEVGRREQAPVLTQPSSQPPEPFDAQAYQANNSRGEAATPVVPVPKPTYREPEPQKIRTPKSPLLAAKYLAPIRGALAKVGGASLRISRNVLAALSKALIHLLKNLLPDADVLRVPPSMMIFIALAIPLILATIGGVVYLQRGRAQQHQIYYNQAVEDAAYAATLTNPLEQRMAWLTVIGDLNKAESYTLTGQSQELRIKAVENLDNLDATKRLDYQPAIVGGLEEGVRITRLVATATDLYMLNAEQGSVLRAIMTGRGYEIDTNFNCGPTSGPIDIGPLVDIAELPPGSFENASLLGMDANGHMLYCVTGSQPYSAVMAPPNTGFGEPIAMTLDRSDLYVLDPKVNAVWIYRNLEVTQQPRLFFGDEIPPMENVIDLAVYNDDLFLLHTDGHITKCTYSAMAESPTRCDDPYPYSDNRPGRIHGPVIEETVFNQIYFLSFPERSIYLLDPQNKSIYYFSVLLNLQWQYQPKKAIAPGVTTAFAISPNRTAFIAIGNSVYYAGMP